MSAPGRSTSGEALTTAHAFDIRAAQERLRERGGYEVIHESAGLEIGVYVLVAPEPDHQQPHADDGSTSSSKATAPSTSKERRSSCAKDRQRSFRPAPSTNSSATST
jgi:hypothetical protein